MTNVIAFGIDGLKLREYKMRTVFCCMLLLSVGVVNFSFGQDNMKAFPPAGDGMTRFVLELAKQEDESSFKVELIVGKTVELDEVNRYFFGGTLKEETIEGWGFPKYVLNELGPMAGTLIGVDPNSPKVKRFITLGGEPFLVRYNSRLPLVVYVPEGAEVRYRIWRADPNAKAMDKR